MPPKPVVIQRLLEHFKDGGGDMTLSKKMLSDIQQALYKPSTSSSVAYHLLLALINNAKCVMKSVVELEKKMREDDLSKLVSNVITKWVEVCGEGDYEALGWMFRKLYCLVGRKEDEGVFKCLDVVGGEDGECLVVVCGQLNHVKYLIKGNKYDDVMDGLYYRYVKHNVDEEDRWMKWTWMCFRWTSKFDERIFIEQLINGMKKIKEENLKRFLEFFIEKDPCNLELILLLYFRDKERSRE
ncbi:hypothetical protein ROZALSC1DRAFT_31808, partial [Rozella allomycis CSF55]